MPRFEPFTGLRYAPSHAPEAVTAPPYDVIDAAQRAELAGRDPHNIVRVDVPPEEAGPTRYELAAATLGTWLEEGTLVVDPEPRFYVYRMAYRDERGQPAHTLGVIGALALSAPGEGEILPHEHTTPKAKSDRLDLLRATEVNLSPIWGLSLTSGLTELCRVEGDPEADWYDDDGVRHTLWCLTDPARLAAISAAVAATPVVIADGHHRYETSLTYRSERTAAEGSAGGAADAMVYVVELADDELTVRPIHRLLDGLPDELDLARALDGSFDVREEGPVPDDVTARMDQTGSLALIRADGTCALLTPKAGLLAAADDLDSARLDVALQDLPPHTLRYQHGVEHVTRMVAAGEAQAGVLLRPATVAQIARNAHEGRRMPPKTTFFHPKPRTGVVLRSTR